MAAWVRRQDTQHRFRLVPYHKAPSPPMTPALYAACAHAVHVVKGDGTVLRGGRACLFVLESLGWKSARLLTFPPLIWAVELAYRIAASNRRIIGWFLMRRRSAVK